MTAEETLLDAPQTPAVFTRLIETPPGLPWDQARIATLEASRTAPVAISTLTLRVRRLAVWRHGEPGRYAALYVKTDELGSGFTACVEVDGRNLSVDFRSKAHAEAERQRTIILIASGAAAVLISLAVLFAAGAARHRAEHKLDSLERLTMRQLQQAQTASELKRQAAALAGVSDLGAPVADVLGDLAWASKMRLPATPLEGYHWRPSAVGVEVRGDATPFPGGEAKRLAKPLRPGVWLWARARGPKAGQASVSRASAP